MFNPVTQDLRSAWRGLRSRPLFATVAMLILALGMAAATTVFSVLYATIIRPLPFPEPDRLLQVSLTIPPSGEGYFLQGRDDFVWSFPKYEVFRDQQQSFSQLAIYSEEPATLTIGDEVERLVGETVAGAYFETLGVPIVVGRGFSAEEDLAPEAPPVAVIGYDLWRDRFGSQRDAVDRAVHLNGRLVTIVGVAAPGFRGLSARSVLWTNRASAGQEELGQAMSHQYYMVGRLAAGVTPGAAQAEAELLGTRLNETFPVQRGESVAWSATTRSLNEVRVDPELRRTVTTLGVAVALLLLLACVNLANLMLARATARQREIAVRLALGASRKRLVSQLLAESGLLAVGGGLLGVGLTYLSVAGIRGVWADAGGGAGNGLRDLTQLGMGSVQVDTTILAFALGLMVLTTLLVGLLPARQSTKPELTLALKEGAVADDRRGGRFSLRDGLVISEVTLAVILLVGAGLLTRSLQKLLAVDIGIRPENVLSLRVAFPPERYAGDSAVTFYADLLTQVEAIPGVSSAALGNCPPLNGGCNGTIIWFRDRDPVPEGTEPMVGVHHVSPGYFNTLGVPVLRGRTFTPDDRIGTPKVVVINEAAARKFWPNEDPIGHHIAVGQGGFHDRAEVIGIVKDIRFGTVEELTQPDVFMSYLQAPRTSAIVYLQTSVAATTVLPQVRQVTRNLMGGMPIYDVRPMDERVRVATIRQRLTSAVLVGFAVSALLLSIIGIYALMAHEVSRRTREIGIRMSLGATAQRVTAMVFRRSALLTGIGLALGSMVALGATGLIRSMLFGVGRGDPVTYVGLIVLLGLAAGLATLVPARRAARIEPMTAIRTE